MKLYNKIELDFYFRGDKNDIAKIRRIAAKTGIGKIRF